MGVQAAVTSGTRALRESLAPSTPDVLGATFRRRNAASLQREMSSKNGLSRGGTLLKFTSELVRDEAAPEGDDFLDTKKLREPGVLFKKQVYKIYLSLFYGVVLFVTALLDISAVYREADIEWVPGKWHTGLLYSHVVSFYVLIMGFIVANETNQSDAQRMALVSLITNVLAFVLRLTYEIAFMDFVPVQYFAPEP